MRADRVQERLDALGIDHYEASLRAGRNKLFLYPLMTGARKGMHKAGAIKIANVLGCSVEYLKGVSDDLGIPPDLPKDDQSPVSETEWLEKIAKPEPSWMNWHDRRLPLAGTVEAGAFRKKSYASPFVEMSSIPPHPDYPISTQSAYLVRGSGLQKRGIHDGMYLTVIAPEAVKGNITNGAIVVVEHTRMKGAEIEISAREIQHYPDRTEFLAHSSTECIDPIILRDGHTDEPNGAISIIGLVIAASLTFDA